MAIKTTSLVALTLTLPGSLIVGQCAGLSATTKPNIIIVLADDLGYGDLGCYGATLFNTPNLDKMAAEGVRFTDFLVPSAVCSASKAVLLTGCYPNRVGISGALNPHSKTGLNPTEETIASLLKKTAYKTIAIGKWHLGHYDQFMPASHGFDEYLGIPYSNDMWPLTYDNVRATPQSHSRKASFPELPLIHNGRKIREFKTIENQEQITTLYTGKAVQFIRENQSAPFFMYLAHSMPHVPLAVSEKFKGKSDQGLYGDVLMEIDWSVGEIIRTLEQCGLTDNTLIIFTSDNGPWLNFGDHAGSSGGLREGKGTSWEGGQRVPCIMKWPGLVPQGSVCSRMASTIDLLPSIAALTETQMSGKKIDGVNILPLMKGCRTEIPRQSFLYFYRENNLEAVRLNNWKLIFPHPGRTYEGFHPGQNGLPGEVNENHPVKAGLFDLRRDPGERYNVIDLYPEIVRQMEQIANLAREDLGDGLTGQSGKNRRKPGIIE